MIYLLYGDDCYHKQKYLKKIIAEIDQNSIVFFEYNQDNFIELINLCNINSLFSKKKAIIINDSSFINYKEEQEKIIAYLNNPNPNTILIFDFKQTNLDQRKKIYKIINSKGIVKQFNQQKDIFRTAKTFFDGYQISDLTIRNFINKVGNNLNAIENESVKLKSYCQSKKITDQDVELITSKYLQPDIFNLIDAIIDKNTKTAITVYQNIFKHNDDTNKIIVLVANQLRLIYQTKQLHQQGYGLTEIANKLKVHPYRIKLAIQKSTIYQEEQIFKLLMKLFDLDVAIKTGKQKSEFTFELFIFSNN